MSDAKRDSFGFESEFRIFLDHISDLICVVKLSGDYQFEIINENAFVRLLGYSNDDLAGKSFLNIVHQDDKNQIKKVFKKKLELVNKLQAIRLKDKRGSYIWVECKTKKFKDDNDKTQLLLILKDISERKKLEERLTNYEDKLKKITNSIPEIRFWKLLEPKKHEEALHASLLMLQTIMENIPQYIFWKDKNLIYLGCNHNYANLIGLDNPEDLIGKTDIELLEDKTKANNLREHELKIVSLDMAEYHEEELWIQDARTRIWLDVNRIPYHDSKGNILGLLVTYENITNRKIAEQKLIESEQQYREMAEKYCQLFEKSPFSIILLDIEGIIVDCNPATEKNIGFKRNDLIGKKCYDTLFAHPKYVPFILEKLKEITQKGELPLIIVQVYSKDGRLIWARLKASLMKFGNQTYIQIIGEDITQRKKAEEDLKESEAKYRELFETTPSVVILANLDGTILECNPAVESLSGYKPEELIGKNFSKLEFYVGDAIEILKNALLDLLNDQLLDYVELQIKKKDGETIWINMKSRLIERDEQKLILAVIFDVTKQKLAEKVIKESEEKLRNLLDTSSVGVLEIDLKNNKLSFINSKLLEILGLERSDLSNQKGIYKFIYPEDFDKLFKSQEEKEIQFRICQKSGKIKWLSGKRINQYSKEGEIISFRLWLEDVTEKKMYESLIYDLNVNFLNYTTHVQGNIELLLSTCLKLLNADLVLFVHKRISEGKVQYLIISSEKKMNVCDSEDFEKNFFASELFKVNNDLPQIFLDLNEMNYTHTDPFLKNKNFKGALGKLIKSEDQFDATICIFYHENPIMTHEYKLVLFLICDAIGIELRRWLAQLTLEDQNKKLSEINQFKTDLFSRTSHELNTPLISIKGFTELLLTLYKDKLDVDIISILEEIKSGSNRLEKIIQLLLEGAKLDQGKLKLNKAREDLAFLIRFCVNEIKGQAKLRNQEIIVDVYEKLETIFDKEKIYEVIVNILMNAIKYTPQNGKITIQSKINENFYVISISDNGIGFTEEEKKHIFKQFGKVERYGQGLDVEIEGTGLGLYVAKEIVELHGGKIWVDSEGRNKGSTFYFSLPITKDE